MLGKFFLFVRNSHAQQQQQRTFSQLMTNFVQPKYLQAYRALVLPQLKLVGLGEKEADAIIEQVEGSENFVSATPHVLSNRLALATYRVVNGALDSKETGMKVAQNTLLAAQLFETSTNRVATMVSWNKKKHAMKVAKDFCRDHQQQRVLDVNVDETNSTVVVTRCSHHQFFLDHGVPELTKVFCRAETALFESASAPKSGLSFELNQTIADGADKCLMRFVVDSRK